MNPRLLSLVLLLLTLPVLAQQRNNEIAVSYGRSQYAQISDSPVVGLSYSHFWSGGLAARLGVHRSEKDFPDNQGDRVVSAYYATAEYHFFRNRLVSPYVGAGIAYGAARQHLSHADFTAEDNTFSAIGDAGVDLNLTPRFAIGADVSYMKFDPNLGDRHGSALDPITTLVSLKYHY